MEAKLVTSPVLDRQVSSSVQQRMQQRMCNNEVLKTKDLPLKMALSAHFYRNRWIVLLSPVACILVSAWAMCFFLVNLCACYCSSIPPPYLRGVIVSYETCRPRPRNQSDWALSQVLFPRLKQRLSSAFFFEPLEATCFLNRL